MSFIHQVPDRRTVCRAYDFWSHFYDAVAGPMEYGARMQALAAQRGALGGRVLDVGVGPGAHFVEIARTAGTGATVCGVDLSGSMVRKASRLVRRGSVGGASVIRADALMLPFADESFDTVMSSYLLDLLPLEAIVGALSEFRRVLKPAGRAVLVNLTKVAADRTTWYESCYRAMPSAVQAYVLGACRPVRLGHIVGAAGFVSIQRTVVQHALPSEIVVAAKPAESESHSRRQKGLDAGPGRSLTS